MMTHNSFFRLAMAGCHESTGHHRDCGAVRIATMVIFKKVRRRSSMLKLQALLERRQMLKSTMRSIQPLFLALPLLLLACGRQLASARLQEHERVREYHARNYTWPLPHYVPDTPGWRKLHEHRFRQISEIKDSRQRYEGYVQAINTALVAPNFTEYGFGLVRAPDDLMEDLRQGIRDGLAQGPGIESEIDVIETPLPSWFINRPDLTQRVLRELQFYPETWSNTELTPWGAYGFRLYRENATLRMHVDRSSTHVVSFILHIDSSEDAEPWPIVIEDFHGVTHEVILKSGDMLLYESSKCLHGRPHKFKGSWYSSIFVHYYPKYGWDDVDHTLEKHYAIPPEWAVEPTTKFEIPLEMVGTGMLEPTCPNQWCQTKYSKKWSGPGKKGILMTPGGEELPFEPKPLVCEDLNEQCPEWASWDTNECQRNPKFMLVNCKKSCKRCTPGMGVTEA